MPLFARVFDKLRRLVNSIFYRRGWYRRRHRRYPGLHLGGGNNRIHDFLNIDANWRSRADVFADLERIHLIDGAADAIYASHVFEHFLAVKAPGILREWARVLRPGGTIYLCVPDAEALFDLYLKTLRAPETAETPQILNDTLHCLVGGQIQPYDVHYNLFSFRTLKAMLEGAGFRDVTRFERDTLDLAPFTDFGSFVYRGVPVSLNVRATKR